MQNYLVTIDIPGIKNFVFGTDPLREIRGGSSLLLQVNRLLQAWLEEASNGCTWEAVFSNGGSAQFTVQCEQPTEINSACEFAASQTRQITGGGAQLVYGQADAGDLSQTAYQRAVTLAHWRMRQMRELASPEHASTTFPLVRECHSTSQQPAQHFVRPLGDQADSVQALSTTSFKKILRSQQDHTAEQSPWSEWLERSNLRRSKQIRCRDFIEIAGNEDGHSRLGLVYADGNAMGKLIPQIDSPTAFQVFSEIVDGSIREACYRALDGVCNEELRRLRSGESCRLPTDILLLGGDDLVVALPAKRALLFAETVAVEFQELTRERISELAADHAARRCFDRLGVRCLTISCGVAVASSRYPIGLLLGLAESLLSNAKQRGSQSLDASEYYAPSMIDFHSITASSSHELKRVRLEQFFVDCPGNVPRTLRPFSLSLLRILRESIGTLHSLDQPIPRGKMKSIYQAATEPSVFRSRILSRELFTRLQRSHQMAFTTILQRFADDEEYDINHYPWLTTDGAPCCLLPDLVDTFDLYERVDSLTGIAVNQGATV